MGRFYIVTGESSGDNLGAPIGQELLRRGHQVAGWGGPKMRAAEIVIDRDLTELKVMGWTDVLMHLPGFARLLFQCRRDIKKFKPDTLILIDFGSFNLRIAKWASNQGIRVVYYSPPKIWASRPGRISTLEKYCAEIIVLFPFERDYFKARGMDVHFFGHPLADVIKSYAPDSKFRERYGLGDAPIVSIIPGSRKAEIAHTLRTYMEAAMALPSHALCVSCAEGMRDYIQVILGQEENLNLIEPRDYYNLLYHTDQAIITSGTATLEATLFRVPHVIGYKTNWLNYQVAKRLIRTPFIGLPNLIAGQGIVPELVQGELYTENLIKYIILNCQPDAKSILANSFNGIINEITLDNCLFNTIVTITGERT